MHLAKRHEWHLVVKQTITCTEANIHREWIVHVTVEDFLLILVAGMLGRALLNVVIGWICFVVIVIFDLHVSEVVHLNVNGSNFWLGK